MATQDIVLNSENLKIKNASLTSDNQTLVKLFAPKHENINSFPIMSSAKEKIRPGYYGLGIS